MRFWVDAVVDALDLRASMGLQVYLNTVSHLGVHGRAWPKPETLKQSLTGVLLGATSSHRVTRLS